MTRSMGSHQSARPKSTTWLTPPHIIEALGGADSFDLDPCAAPEPRPWPTARRMNSIFDANGLMIEWDGRVWLNPPFTTGEVGPWLKRMAAHNQGTVLINARTETEAVHAFMWEFCSGVLFLKGRLHFHYPDGSRAPFNAGAPSVLCAYGQDDLDRLMECGLAGKPIPLRFARFLLVAGLDGSWTELVRDFLSRQRGPVSLDEAYRYFSRHPKAKNRHWRAKVRQKLQQVGRRVAPATYEGARA